MERKNMSYPFGRFSISREGRVRRRNNPMRKIEKLRDGRWVVTLRDLNNMGKNCKVVIAREVYRLWVGPVLNGGSVYHIDGNMDNNVPENLAVGNMHAMTMNKKERGTLHHQINNKLTAKQVKEIREKYKKKIDTHDISITCKLLGKEYGVSMQAIQSIVSWTSWKNMWK